MGAWLTILSLSLSSSIDNFGVGISYGIRGIRVSLLANLVMSCIAFVFSEAGIWCGQYLSKVFPGKMSNVIGAVFLFVIGIRIVLMTIPKKNNDYTNDLEEEDSSITGYLNSPERADFDKNGDISFIESIVLGTAVSMNALTNGLGAGLFGLSPFAISLCAAIFSFLAIWGGVMLGGRVATVKIGSWSLGQFSTVISGVILLIIAIHSLL